MSLAPCYPLSLPFYFQSWATSPLPDVNSSILTFPAPEQRETLCSLSMCGQSSPQRTKTPCTAHKSRALIFMGVALFLIGSWWSVCLSVLDTQSHQSPCGCPERSSFQVSLACLTLPGRLSHSLSMKMACSS